jgi:hypothetical protein
VILYVNRTGIPREYLPHDFPPYKSVCDYYAKSETSGTTEQPAPVPASSVLAPAGERRDSANEEPRPHSFPPFTRVSRTARTKVTQARCPCPGLTCARLVRAPPHTHNQRNAPRAVQMKRPDHHGHYLTNTQIKIPAQDQRPHSSPLPRQPAPPDYGNTPN